MKAGEAGGIEAVVKAINTHIKNVGVCENGCCALNYMALNGKHSDKTLTNTNTNEMNS